MFALIDQSLLRIELQFSIKQSKSLLGTLNWPLAHCAALANVLKFSPPETGNDRALAPKTDFLKFEARPLEIIIILK